MNFVITILVSVLGVLYSNTTKLIIVNELFLQSLKYFDVVHGGGAFGIVIPQNLHLLNALGLTVNQVHITFSTINDLVHYQRLGKKSLGNTTTSMVRSLNFQWTSEPTFEVT